MSINSCSIDAQSIDALCGSRRALIIQGLRGLLPQPSTGKPHQQHVNPNYKGDFRIFRREPEVEEVVESFEQPWIEVTIEMHGQTFTQSMERGPDVVPMINVSSLTLSEPIDLNTDQVNISDLTFRIL